MKFTVLLMLLLFPVVTAFCQVYGCTDPLANNFNIAATQNDGSCSYNTTAIAPVTSFNLPPNLIENSGLTSRNGQLWTHNDNLDINIYAIDTGAIAVNTGYPVTGYTNTDWEDIAQDSLYFYVGDFGNNVYGNRTDLKILRIEKSSLQSNPPLVDTIHYSYSLQTNFSNTGINNTDFDCEAFLISNDSIYLFTKQWLSKQTSVYSLPNIPGSHVAQHLYTYDVNGLITGATWIEPQKLAVLSGYSSLLEPFLFLLYDYKENEFFSGNKRKVTISLPFHQVEGITTENGTDYFISNEKFVQSFITTDQKLHLLDLDSLLGGYLSSFQVNTPDVTAQTLRMYPNPAENMITVEIPSHLIGEAFMITDISGKIVIRGTLTSATFKVSLKSLNAGNYVLSLNDGQQTSISFVKR